MFRLLPAVQPRAGSGTWSRTLQLWLCSVLSLFFVSAGALAATGTSALTPAPQRLSCESLSPDKRARHLLVVSGLGGESYYRDLFARWVVDFAELSRSVLRIPEPCIVVLGEGFSGDGTESVEGTPPSMDGPATRDRILAEISRLADVGKPGDVVLLFAVGHGTSRGNDVRFNIPGPDLTAEDLDQALAQLDGLQVVVVLATSASGAFMPRLSRPDRIVITATSSAQENRHARFGGAFVEAYASPGADTDKNGQISIAEAFAYAQHRVTEIYKSDKRLQTEHALLDDHADGRAAARLHLGFERGADDGVVPSAPILALSRNAKRLVEQVEALKRDRKGLSEDEFYHDLEILLVELAINQRSLRAQVSGTTSTQKAGKSDKESGGVTQ